MMWSIGNEVAERSSPEGLKICWNLPNEVCRLDSTRPVTAAMQNFLCRLIAAAAGSRARHADEVDQPSTVFFEVASYNHKLGDIEGDPRLYSRRIIYAFEVYAHDP